jgi:hypothetical protein
MKHIETDPDSGASIHLLAAYSASEQNTPTNVRRSSGDARSTDNIYGEQPFSSSDGTRITVRHYSSEGIEAGLSIVDLEDGSLYPIPIDGCRFPAFHAWSEHLYYQEPVARSEGDRLMLKRCNYRTLETETVALLPADEGRLSYGTVSGDGRYYAVAAHRDELPCRVLLIDLATGEQRTLAESSEYFFKHEQFSLDGRNRVLIQANKMPEVKEVHLGVMEVDREGVDWFAADRPHTPRPTGHETWIGCGDRVFFSTAFDEERQACVWTVGLEDEASAPAQPACIGSTHFGHVSVSRCGHYFIADDGSSDGVPIYAGSLSSGRCRRLLLSHTMDDGNQWSHTHPYLTADNKWLIYTSNRSGLPQVYGAQVPEEFWESL